MKRFFGLLLLGLCLLSTTPAEAAESKINIAIVRQSDGTTLGELWCNEQVIWRIRICADGARAAATGAGSETTVVVPDIINGMFMLKVYNE